MRLRLLSAVVAALSLVTTSCSENDPTGPSASSLRPRMDFTAAVLPAVRISEFHYDNDGADVGERVEISYPAGTSLTGYSLVYVNGSGGAVYGTAALSGGVTAICGDRGVAVFNGPGTGIQNGSPDGIALVSGTTIIQFISYEGITTGVGGVTADAIARDIRVSEPSNSPAANSLQMDANGSWYGPVASTFGSCNDNTANSAIAVTSVSLSPASPSTTAGNFVKVTATAVPSSAVGTAYTWTSSNTEIATVDYNGTVTGQSAGTAQITATAPSGAFATVTVTISDAPSLPPVRFTEIHYDNDADDINEAIEIGGPAGTDLTGWSVVLYNGSTGAAYDTRTLSGTIPAMCSGRGVVYLLYLPNGIQNGPNDGFALVNGSGAIVEFLSYEGSFTATDGPAVGMAATDIGVSEAGSTPYGRSLSRNGTGVWQAPAPATIGACNTGEGPAPPALPNAIIITGRTAFDAPLPVGFEDQLFATLRSGATGAVITTTFTWSAETPSIATIDQDGVIRGVSAGTAVFRATAGDGTTRTYELPIIVATAGDASYQNHVEFGVPTDSNPANDFIINRTEYLSSFSVERGIPNWVSYNLDESHFGEEDRCDCFTFDPELPQAGRYTTADYTGAGAFHGYGIDRGHLARSFDRTSGSLDNARTFYFSNIFPQAADFNQGTWGDLETDLGNLARFANKELYIITGVSGTLGTVKNEGLITIPAYAWKVAVVLDRDEGLSSIDSYDDLEVIAVAMPNDSLVSGPWENYSVSVDSVEKLSGYDLLSALPDYIEVLIESEAGEAFALIQQLVTDGVIKAGVGNSLSVKLDAAITALAAGNSTAALNQLNSLLNEINALEKSGRLSASNANALRDALAGIIAAASA